MNLQTIVDIGFSKLSKGLKLKDETIVLYQESYLILYNKILSSEIKCFSDNNGHYYKDIKSIKQLKNGNILCCNDKLFIIKNNIKLKKYEIDTIEISKEKSNEKNEKFLDVIELYNETIIGITNNSLYNIKFLNGNYKLTSIFDIPEDWLIFWGDKYSYETEVNLNIYELKNNRLLFHSYSYFFRKGCLFNPGTTIKESKIFIIDLNDFKVIYKENFPDIANIIVLNDCFCIRHSNTIFIYNINDYKILQKIGSNIEYINKYNDKIIIASNKIKDIILYNLSDINNIQYEIFCFNLRDYCFGENIIKFICKFRHKTILILANYYLFIAEFPRNFNFKPIAQKKNSDIDYEIDKIKK